MFVRKFQNMYDMLLHSSNIAKLDKNLRVCQF